MVAVWLAAALIVGLQVPGAAEPLVGFAKRDITPEISADRPVWIAGYGHNRRAEGVHDPLYCRCLVLDDGGHRIALVSVDLIGLQYPDVERIRADLHGFDYVMVASTHQHEGPDVIGIWGPTPIQRGVDADYVDRVVNDTVAAVREAVANLRPFGQAKYGMAHATGLLRDARLPHVEDDVIRTLQFLGADGKPLALLVQFSNHPESLGSRNQQITADFPHATIRKLEEHFQCPVAYFTGAVGGLMTNPGEFTTADGRQLHDGNFEFAEEYGKAVADVAIQATQGAEPVGVTPIQAVSARITIPLENPHYVLARSLGVLTRKAYAWTGDFRETIPWMESPLESKSTALLTEVALLKLGEIDGVCIPGEIYPELIYGKYQEPVEKNVDFPDAPLEPFVTSFTNENRLLLFGLANDEVGYIIPRRQWDQSAPYAYGRNESQYGEINSCGSQVAPIMMQALRALAEPPDVSANDGSPAN